MAMANAIKLGINLICMDEFKFSLPLECIRQSDPTINFLYIDQIADLQKGCNGQLTAQR